MKSLFFLLALSAIGFADEARLISSAEVKTQWIAELTPPPVKSTGSAIFDRAFAPAVPDPSPIDEMFQKRGARRLDKPLTWESNARRAQKIQAGAFDTLVQLFVLEVNVAALNKAGRVAEANAAETERLKLLNILKLRRDSVNAIRDMQAAVEEAERSRQFWESQRRR
jgi:hypothetical protein